VCGYAFDVQTWGEWFTRGLPLVFVCGLVLVLAVAWLLIVVCGSHWPSGWGLSLVRVVWGLVYVVVFGELTQGVWCVSVGVWLSFSVFGWVGCCGAGVCVLVRLIVCD